MKAVVYTRFGPPEVLHPAEVPKPVPKPNEVLIRIDAATVTKYDCWVRGFKLSTRLLALLFGMNFGLRRPKRPILGTEVAGEVEAVGRRVSLFTKGDRVFAYPGMSTGAYAEYICMPEDGVLATKPANMTVEEAAAVQQGALTALFFLRKADIRSGQKVLIFGASGGVGLFAVQIAKYLGAEVTGVSSTSKLELVRSVGADRVIDYTKEDFTRRGDIYDVVFDTMGRSPFSGSLRSLKPDGVYLLVTAGLPRLLRILWHRMTSRKRVLSPLLRETTEDLIFIRDLIEAGRLRAAIDRCYPLERAAEAHRYVESGKKKGQVVITVSHCSET